VSLVGSTAKIDFKQDGDGLHVELPAKPAGVYAYSFRITRIQ